MGVMVNMMAVKSAFILGREIEIVVSDRLIGAMGGGGWEVSPSVCPSKNLVYSSCSSPEQYPRSGSASVSIAKLAVLNFEGSMAICQSSSGGTSN